MSTAQPVDPPRSNATKLAKKFKCRRCDRLFTRSEHRSRHELSHNPERPWRCTECSSSFVRRDLLLRHARTVHGSTTIAGPAIKRGKAGQKQPDPLVPNKPIHMNPNGILDPRGPHLPGIPGQDRDPAASSLLSLANMSTAAADVSTAMLMTEMHNHAYSVRGQDGQPGQDGLPSPVNGLGPQGQPLPSPPKHHDHAYIQKIPGGGGASLPSLSSSVWGTQGIMQAAETSRPNDLASLNSSVWRSDSQTPTLGAGMASAMPVRQHHRKASDDFDSLSRMLREDDDYAFRRLDRGHHNSLSQMHNPQEHSQRHMPSSHQQHHSQYAAKPHGSPEMQHPQVKIEPETVVRQAQNTYANIPQISADFDIEPLIKTLRPYPAHNPPINPKLTRLQVNRYLSAYFNMFHPIIPMLHLQTFDCTQTSPTLFFAICAVGALLCREQNVADALSYNARRLINALHQPDREGGNALVTAQSLVIIILFSVFSGDRSALEGVGSLRTSLVNMIDSVVDRKILKGHNNKPMDHSWHSWIEEQTVIRSYYCSLIASTTLTAIYKYPTTISFDNMPRVLPLPCSEVLWNSAFNDEHTWRQAYQRDLAQFPHTNLGQLMALLDRVGETDIGHIWTGTQDMPQLNPFGIRILGNFMLSTTARASGELATKRLRQIRFAKLSAKDYTPGQGQGPMLAVSAYTFINLFEPLEASVGTTMPPTMSFMRAFVNQQHPMIILSHILLGLARLQLVLDLGRIRENLQFHGAQHVAEAAISCSAMINGDEKLENMLSAVVTCFDVLRVPCILGLQMAGSFISAPASGMITSLGLIFGFELVVALLLWCHCVEERLRAEAQGHIQPVLPSRVREAYNWIEQTITTSGHAKINGTIVPALAEVAASTYDSVKVWRLAEVMSASLRLVGQGLSRTHARQSYTFDQTYNDGPLSYEYLSYS